MDARPGSCFLALHCRNVGLAPASGLTDDVGERPFAREALSTKLCDALSSSETMHGYKQIIPELFWPRQDDTQQRQENGEGACAPRGEGNTRYGPTHSKCPTVSYEIFLLV